MTCEVKPMRSRIWAGAAMFAALLGVVRLAAAHHGSVAFDPTVVTTLNATITDFQWTNPHSRIRFTAPNAKGASATWLALVDSPRLLTLKGWTPQTLKPGDRVVVIGYRAKDGTNYIHIKKLVLADSTQLNPNGFTQ